jgi:hypothetical protein
MHRRTLFWPPVSSPSSAVPRSRSPPSPSLAWHNVGRVVAGLLLPFTQQIPVHAQGPPSFPCSCARLRHPTTGSALLRLETTTTGSAPSPSGSRRSNYVIASPPLLRPSTDAFVPAPAHSSSACSDPPVASPSSSTPRSTAYSLRQA